MRFIVKLYSCLVTILLIKKIKPCQKFKQNFVIKIAFFLPRCSVFRARGLLPCISYLVCAYVKGIGFQGGLNWVWYRNQIVWVSKVYHLPGTSIALVEGKILLDIVLGCIELRWW